MYETRFWNTIFIFFFFAKNGIITGRDVPVIMQATYNAVNFQNKQKCIELYVYTMDFLKIFIIATSFLLQICALPSERSSERHILHENAGTNMAWAAVMSQMNYTQTKVTEIRCIFDLLNCRLPAH